MSTPAVIQHENAPSLAPAEKAELMKLLGLPDVSGMIVSMDMHEASDIVELRAAVQERLAHAKAVFTDLIADLEVLAQQSTDELRRRARAGGGTQIVSGSYRIAWPKGQRAGTPTKTITKLLELRGKITPAEFAKAFSGSTHIGAMLDADTLSKIKALIPGADRVVKTDIQADGGVLNQLVKSYGPESEVAAIISAGYIPNRIEFDEDLKVEPILGSARSVVDVAVENGGELQ